jgi:hypothetical protein
VLTAQTGWEDKREFEQNGNKGRNPPLGKASCKQITILKEALAHGYN